MSEEKKKYTVRLNEEINPHYADTEQEAWDIIGEHPLGTRYEVTYTDTGAQITKFIPF